MRSLGINKNAAAVVGALAMALLLIARPTYFSFPLPLRPRRKSKRKSHIYNAYGVSDGVVGAVGNTPLIRINSLSEATGCQIFAKAEFMNPGGSVKDRVAATIIQEALQSGELVKEGIVTEGSAGSTAISLATLAPAYGCKCHVVIPDDAAIEKAQILEALGATVERVRPVSITHKDHFVNVARRRAMEAAAYARKKESQEINGADKQVLKPCNNGDSKGSYDGIDETIESARENPMTGTSYYKCKGGGGFFADQFENLANFRAHYQGTGPEIWEQTAGKLHAFVAAAGTGGTLAGISCFLKDNDANVKCFLVDPPGSGLFNKITRGVMYTCQEAEGKRLKNPFDTITEGIGINRITENFQMARLDGAFRATDMEAVEMSRFLLKNDGLFVGSSSAVNCVGAVRVARQLGPGHTIVTILCDSGMRHLTKFYNPHYLAAHNLTPCASGLEFLGKT